MNHASLNAVKARLININVVGSSTFIGNICERKVAPTEKGNELLKALFKRKNEHREKWHIIIELIITGCLSFLFTQTKLASMMK